MLGDHEPQGELPTQGEGFDGALVIQRVGVGEQRCSPPDRELQVELRVGAQFVGHVPAWLVVHREGHLHDGVPAHLADRILLGHHFIEREQRVVHGGQVGVADEMDEVIGGQPRPQHGSQGDGGHEHSHHVGRLGVAPERHRGAHGDIVGAARDRQRQRESSVIHVEVTDTESLCRAAHRIHGARRHRDCHGRCTQRSLRVARSAVGEFEDSRVPAQRLGPEVEHLAAHEVVRHVLPARHLGV